MIVGGISQLLGGGVGPVEISLTANALSTADLTVYTFSGLSFGAGAGNRIIAVAITSGMAGTLSHTVNAVSIGGVSASQVVTAFQLGSAVVPSLRSDVWAVNVPAGASGDVVVTMSGAIAASAVDVYRILNASVAPYHTATFISSDLVSTFSASLNLIANGAAIGILTSHNALTTVWTNLTERTDRVVDAGVACTSADATTLSTQTLTITATTSATGRGALALVSFSPL